MSQGKAIAQAGHAYTDTLLLALDDKDPSAAAYAALKPGTKIALTGGDAEALRDLHVRLRAAGLPAALIVDSGHIELPDFDGSPTITALGIGPIDRRQARKFLGRLKLWGGAGTGGAP